MKSFAEIAFTPTVQTLQERHGSRAAYAGMQAAAEPGEGLGLHEVEHLGNADSFYMATVSEAGWPYVQHRGGPRGFLKVVSPTRLAFADFAGNRQFVSVGNASGDDRISLIVVDYPNRRRLKLFGRLRFEATIDTDPAMERSVELAGYRARVERIGVIDLEALDWNCPQHITPRFTVAEIEAAALPLHERIRQLEGEIAALRGCHAEEFRTKRQLPG
jgi:predicted pyridoxine 5'-phosphate oxidase superfamily flavin-nucleotide-binding protein